MKKQARVFTLREQLQNIQHGAKGFVLLKQSKKHRLLNPAWKERIMLAITQVNGCAMCSFVHTKLALETGMDNAQIKALLDGDISDVPEPEAVSVLFGQHFAASKESPDGDALNRLIEEYGIDRTNCILAACHMITMTNGMGISMDHLWHRIKWRRNKESNLLVEVFNPLLTMLLFPPLVVYHWLTSAFHRLRFLSENALMKG
jgi:AhpD family alkylhydroperoxidase